MVLVLIDKMQYRLRFPLSQHCIAMAETRQTFSRQVQGTGSPPQPAPSLGTQFLGWQVHRPVEGAGQYLPPNGICNLGKTNVCAEERALDLLFC